MDYQNGKIYVIRNHINALVYVGSTTQALSKRMAYHRSDYKRKTTSKFYQACNEIGIDEFHIELLEDCPCESREQLLRREGYYIREYDSYNNGYNGRIEGQTKKEYRQANKEARKEYIEANKEAIAERMKEYRQDNKETLAIQQKIYFETNKEAINERRRQRYKDKKHIDDVSV
jgi:group I intron endonuclease